MNAQTPGPIIACPSGPVMQGYSQPLAIAQQGTPNLVAGVFGDVKGGQSVAEANAELLAASYSAFDRAGRELGMDAVELARSLDLVALIQSHRDTLQALSVFWALEMGDTQNDTIDAARAILAKIAAPRD